MRTAPTRVLSSAFKIIGAAPTKFEPNDRLAPLSLTDGPAEEPGIVCEAGRESGAGSPLACRDWIALHPHVTSINQESRMMKRFIPLGIVFAIGFMSRPASAGIIQATGTWSAVLDADHVNFDYTIKLTNTSASTDVVGTFWFSWVPGADFMVNNPISETTPAGWVANITHVPNIPTNGFAIQWVANAGSEIPIGSSLTFGFKSAETPTQLAGISPITLNGSSFPEGVSVLYNGKPFSADSQTIVVAAVPEPSTLALMLVAGLAVVGYKRRKSERLSQMRTLG
jgi:PEP-CTERM motif